ncbi:MAG: hypothetical protein QG670_1741 [Thermoproteota archaeon]|nr:hypothetical protein [Thermoproteota archaeon]
MPRTKNEKEILERLRESIVNLDVEGVQKACEQAISSGIPAYDVVVHGMANGMEEVGKKYEAREYFLSELIIAGEVMKEGMKILEPHLKTRKTKPVGKIVIGTVKGDIHDIGKNVTVTLLGAAGFEIIDLGVDVPVEKFVDAVREHKPDILAMSALLTLTMPEMEAVIEALRKAKLRDRVKIIIGGASITAEYAKKIGADAGVREAFEGVKVVKAWS